MSDSNTTVNLTPVLVVWSLVFAGVALITKSWGYLWLAAAPWLVVMVFVVAVWVFAACVLVTKYRAGTPINVTTRKGVRSIQRGRKPIWIVRR